MTRKILKENIIYIVIIIVLVIIFSLIMRSSLHDKIILFDNTVRNAVDNFVDDRLTPFFRIITNFGDLYIPGLILVCIFIILKNKWYFILQTGGYLIAGIITYISKLLIARPRPIEALISMPRSFSFPSGHTLTSLVFYSLLFYLLTKKCRKEIKITSGIILSLLIIFVAFSRIYLGVHYLSDVIGGLLIGMPCLLIIINIINKNFIDKIK